MHIIKHWKRRHAKTHAKTTTGITIIFYNRIILFAFRFLTMENVRDREVTCSESDRQGSISDRVSGGQCHLIHLTIPRRFSWPSLAHNVHKGGHSFHFICSHSNYILKRLEVSHISYNCKVINTCTQIRHRLRTYHNYIFLNECSKTLLLLLIGQWWEMLDVA